MCCRRWQTRRRCRQVARSAWNALKAEGGRECEKARTRIEPHSRLLALNPPLAFHAFQRPAPPPPQLRPGILLETLLLPPLAAPPLFVPPAGDLPGEVAVAEPEGEPGGQGNGAQDEGEGGGDDLLGDADLLDRHEDRDEDHRGLGEFGEGRDPFHRAGGGEDEPAHELAEDDAEDDDDDPGDERRDEAEHHLEHLADALEAEGGTGEEDHHQHHEPEDQAADRAHRVDAAARRAAERGGEPAPFRGAVEVELVEGAVDEALHLAGQQVAGREDHERHDERGEDPAQGIEGLAQPFHEFGHVVTSMASLPAWAPEWRRRKASMARSSGTTVSITGRRSPCCASAATARYSERLPIVDPRIDHWCQKRRRRSNEAAGPLVAAQLTTRPPRARERSDRSQVASPTLSTTTRHPLRPVSRFTSATTSAGEGELVRGGAGRDDARAEVLRDPDAHLRHAAAGPPDQDRLPGAEPGAAHHHPPRGQRREGEPRRLGPRPPRRAGGEVHGGELDELGGAAVAVLTEDLVGGAEGGVVGLAGGAVAAADAGVEYHLVPRLHRRHPGADLDHDPRAVGADDVREDRRRAGDPAGDEEVEPVERDRADLESDPPRRRRPGPGEIRHRKAVEASGGGEYEGAHGLGAGAARRSGNRGSR